MTIIKGPRFKKEFAKLPKQIQKRAEKQFTPFVQNPIHPSLQTKKTEGWKDVWEGRITKGYRFSFTHDGNTYTLRRIDPHDILRNP
ncbi:hypothetical protein CL632_02205 [bacterium]|jgi:mRNA-degrading endonuclease RelE of RelBE toxin-antitoxin system|nr:hypothetical protein [bacterium]MDP6756415.1 hypothetical protein [Patescibacteria group bacterium]|tara:strand:- start:724 stop:981 length:258 start_codon:yes stop_codon:yes gene_type:complete